MSYPKTFLEYVQKHGKHRAAGCLFFHPEHKQFGVGVRSQRCDTPLHYGPIGGGVEEGENWLSGLIREINEEIGCRRDTYGQLHHLDTEVAGNLTYRTYVTIIDPTKFNPVLNDENTAFTFISHTMPPLPLHPGFAKTLGKPEVKDKLDQLVMYGYFE